MTGTIVNAAAIIAGGLIGVTFKKGISENMRSTLTHGLALAIALVGLQMALETRNPLIVVVSIALGAVVGELMNIEGWLNRMAQQVETKIAASDGNLARAFVSASLVFCVGAMAIMGSIEDGLTGYPKILYAKSLMDAIVAVVFASTMGVGVVFSAAPVFVYQGSITLAAKLLGNFLSPAAITELTATGGLLIVGIALNLLGITKVRLGNLLPAVIFAALLASLWK